MTRFPAVEAFRGGDGFIRVVGHRGARGILPENTLISFEFAMSTGAHLLEFDVVMTADHVPVITHNHRLHAPTFRDDSGNFLTDEPKVSDVTWEQLQSFDVGRVDVSSAYGRRFPDQARVDGLRVPRLSELLERVKQPRFDAANLMLEIKSDPDFAHDPAYREALVSRVVAEVRAAGMQERTLLHSFDWNLLAECQDQAPDFPTSFLTQLPDNDDEVGEDSSKSISPDFSGREHQIPSLVAKAGGSLWCPHVNDVTAETVADAHNLELVVAVWTVNEPEDIDRMIDFDVDAIVSDYPGRVQGRLEARGYSWT